MMMAYQPPSRTRFYRDKRNGKVMGICAGIADYTGFDVSLVRITMIAAVFLSSGSILPVYFIAGWIAPDRPRELEGTDLEEREFWRSVRQSPARTARDIRLRLKDIDRRLADVESYVTTENRSLAREIEQLR
jgi:phage shock protein C